MQIGLLQWMFLGAALAVNLVSAPTLVAQAKIQSGPQPGNYLPGSFAPFVVNGPDGLSQPQNNTVKRIAPPGRYRSLMCQFGLRPAVYIFTRTDPGKNPPDAQLVSLVTKLKTRLAKDTENVGSLQVALIFLNSDSQSAVMEQQAKSNTMTPELEKQINTIKALWPEATNPADEAKQKEQLDAIQQTLENSAKAVEGLWKQRQKLRKKLLQNWVNGLELKDIRVAHYPQKGPTGFKIAKEAEHTILLAVKHKVYANFAYRANDMDDSQVTAIMQRLEKQIGQKTGADPDANKMK
ncbi:MAG: hypothetical protein ACFCD0_04495 [Gemmataceae bacterium]